MRTQQKRSCASKRHTYAKKGKNICVDYFFVCGVLSFVVAARSVWEGDNADVCRKKYGEVSDSVLSPQSKLFLLIRGGDGKFWCYRLKCNILEMRRHFDKQ